jgi:hypothetical protein
LTHLDLSATNFAVLHNRPVRCRADCSAIFADFKLAFALAIAALAAVQSAEERERILDELRSTPARSSFFISNLLVATADKAAR